MADPTPAKSETEEVQADPQELRDGVPVRSGRKTRILVTPSVFKSLRWSKTECLVGEEVQLQAELEASAQGSVEFEIFEHDADGEHDPITKLSAPIEGGKAVAPWKAQYVDDRDDVESDEELEKFGYTFPEFFFEARLGTSSKKSGTAEDALLKMAAVLDLSFVDETGQAWKELPYVLTQADGKRIDGQADGAGKLHQDRVVPGPVFVELDIF